MLGLTGSRGLSPSLRPILRLGPITEFTTRSPPTGRRRGAMRPRLRTTTPTTRRACLSQSPVCQCGSSMTLKSRASALARVTTCSADTANNGTARGVSLSYVDAGERGSGRGGEGTFCDCVSAYRQEQRSHAGNKRCSNLKIHHTPEKRHDG